MKLYIGYQEGGRSQKIRRGKGHGRSQKIGGGAWQITEDQGKGQITEDQEGCMADHKRLGGGGMADHRRSGEGADHRRSGSMADPVFFKLYMIL